MTRADLVLYRRMRGLFWGLLVVAGIALPALLVVGIATSARMDLLDESARRGARAASLIEGGFGITSLVLMFIGAIVLGATAGSVDLQRGVVRDLVLAGRPRWRIVVGRLLGAATWLVAALAVSMGLVVALSLLLTPYATHVDSQELLRQAALTTYPLVYVLPLAAGIAMLVGSRGPAIAVYFVVALLVDNVLAALPKVGTWWSEVSLSQADTRINAWIQDVPVGIDDMGVSRAIATVLAWGLLTFVVGTWRLSRRDL